MTHKRNAHVALSFLVLFFALVGAAAALEKEFVETFPFTADGRLSLDNVNGDVELHAWDAAEVKVRYVMKARTEDGLERMKVVIDASADRIHIETDYEESRRGWFGNHDSGEVSFEIWVPRQARLDEIDLVNGGLEIRDFEGGVTASLVNGDLVARGLRGDVELETVNGSLEVSMTDVAPDQRLSLETVNGRLELTLPGGVGADIEAETVHGSIRNDFGLVEERGRYVGNSLRGSLGGGGARIELESVNGSISIRSQ